MQLQGKQKAVQINTRGTNLSLDVYGMPGEDGMLPGEGGMFDGFKRGYAKHKANT